jgi:hypothetical protein
MVYQNESKLQGWRALAIFEDGSECLVYLGRSTTQVRNGYVAAYEEIFTDEERAGVRSISLQCWQGAPDEGKWIPKATLRIPASERAAANGQPDAKSRLLPFRQLNAQATQPADASTEFEEAQTCIAPTG